MYLWLHALVVEDNNKHLHKVFVANVHVEGCRTLVHQHVEQTQSQKHHLRFVGQQTLPNLVGCRLAAKR